MGNSAQASTQTNHSLDKGEVTPWSCAEALFPICRSITGNGVRQTLEIMKGWLPITVHEVPSGTKVLDWTIPDEWNIRDAWIRDVTGKKVVDFQDSNLHVVSYSEPVRKWVRNDELQQHLYSIPERPDWIPYRTSYYRRTWGFCLAETQRRQLSDEKYEVCIDATLLPGSLTYAELFLPGEEADEFLFSSHVCHPSLGNDNVSGMALSVCLARYLAQLPKRRRSYRFLYTPGTIGAITWLALNTDTLGRLCGGLTLVCLGDSAALKYKRTFQGDTEIDQAVAVALRDRQEPHEIVEFSPYGYDERQFNAPGFRLSVGSLMRSRHGAFPEYHTSADDLSFISATQLESSFECLRAVVEVLEGNERFVNQFPYGEPQFGKHGIDAESEKDAPGFQLALLWVLNLSDGQHTLLNIAERSGLPFFLVRRAATILATNAVIVAAS